MLLLAFAQLHFDLHNWPAPPGKTNCQEPPCKSFFRRIATDKDDQNDQTNIESGN